MSIAITSNNYIISASEDKTIKIWNLLNRKILHSFENAHKKSVISLALIYDTSNNYIISGSKDTTIKIWNI